MAQMKSVRVFFLPIKVQSTKIHLCRIHAKVQKNPFKLVCFHFFLFIVVFRRVCDMNLQLVAACAATENTHLNIKVSLYFEKGETESKIKKKQD